MSQSATIPGLSSITSKLLGVKEWKGLTFDEIAKAIGKDEVWTAAAFYGQAKFTPEELNKLFEVLGLSPDSQTGQELQAALSDHQWWPNRGLGPMPPTDPVIYRLYESVLVYGHSIKAIIHEKFGDGIMSMIDCKIHIDKKADPKGDRVVLTFDGKFLPYARW
ncbi:cyanate lyase C-terminal domain-containing protein [Mycena leptocephala]|nr:cyanate lyase C-terminal domain-containing protein [Mycena leptocephala]